MTDATADEAASSSASPRHSVARRATIVTVLLTAIVITILDQATKIWALRSLEMGERRTVIDGVLEWVLATNSGAAFSFLSGATWVFTVISSLVVIAIVLNLRRVQAMNWAVIVGLVLGGAAGNLIDRLFREPGFGVGHVIDFIYTPWIVPAIYNVADMGVVIGMVLFLLMTLLGVQADGRRARRTRETSEEEA